MTFPEVTDGTMCHAKRNPMSVGCELRESVRQAMDENRLTCGVYECVKLLKCNPDNVMMCVLPNAGNANDVTVHIQHTLIEAFCWENDIKIVKVSSSVSLAKVLLDRETENSNDNNDNNIATRSQATHSQATHSKTSSCCDVSCVLIEYPKLDLSKEDDAIVDYYNTVLLGDIYPKPVIELPE